MGPQKARAGPAKGAGSGPFRPLDSAITGRRTLFLTPSSTSILRAVACGLLACMHSFASVNFMAEVAQFADSNFRYVRCR